MSFDFRDIRRSMDVYTRDNIYLGIVLAVTPGAVEQTGEQVAPDARQSSTVNGELGGPMPTEPLGNPGPTTQSAHGQYATQPDTDKAIGRGSITVGKWWGLLGRRTISIDVVQTVSLERVVLKYRNDELGAYL